MRPTLSAFALLGPDRVEGAPALRGRHDDRLARSSRRNSHRPTSAPIATSAPKLGDLERSNPEEGRIDRRPPILLRRPVCLKTAPMRRSPASSAGCSARNCSG